MKRSHADSFQETEERQSKKINYLNEDNCWEALPLEFRKMIYSYLAVTPYPPQIHVSKEWKDEITKSFNSLNSLNLVRFSNFIDDSVLLLVSRRFCSVKKLTIGKIGVNMPVTEQGLSSLVNFKKLQNLNLIACKLSCNILKALAEHVPQLVSLNMTWCIISDDCVSYFSLFHNLKHLSIQEDSPHVSDSGLTQLAGLEQLSSLNLSFCCGISDEGIIHTVKNLPNIESLNLSWCAEVTDLSLLHIGAKLTKLKTLYLTGCRKISMDGKNFIRRNIPDCKVYSDSNFIPFKLEVHL